MIETWSSVFQQSLQDIWLGTASFLPKFIIAVVIIVLGWAFGNIVDKLIAQVAKALKIDGILKSAKLDDIINKAGFNLDVGKFLGGLVKWFIIVVFLVAAFDVLGLSQVNQFLSQIVLIYLPRVIEGAIILLAAAVIAEFLQRLMVGAAKAAEIKSANLAGVVTKWAIWIFALLVVLSELGIAPGLIQTIFTGIVVALALALGLSFGLGGQAAAADAIEKVKREIASHHHTQ